MSGTKTPAKTRAQARKSPNRATHARTGPFLSGKLNAVLSVVLAVVTIALYSPAMSYLFVVWDDRDYVTGNWHVHHGLAWNTVKWAFTSMDAANWHPLTWLSHALDYQLFALNPAGHHMHSVLIHALNAVLLFLLLVWVTKRVGPSILVAALFAVHPLNVESVAWVAERKNVLSTLYFFLTLGAYVWYVQKPSWRRYFLVASLFAAALMAKPMVITLPFVLLLLDYWPLQRTPAGGGTADSDGTTRMEWSKLVMEKIPLLLLSSASAMITIKAQQKALHTFAESPFLLRVENAVVSYALYLWKMLWPTRLAALYPFPPTLLPVWQVVLSAFVLIGATALVVTFRHKRYLPMGWFWFLGTLVPVIGLVQVGEAAMADRYAYIPLIGLFTMIAWSLDDWAEARKVSTAWRLIPVMCVLIALAGVTLRQMSHWESEYAVWAHTVKVTDNNPGAHGRLAAALQHPAVAMTKRDLESLDTPQKRLELARQQYEEALSIDSQLARQNPDAQLANLAMLLNDFGALDGIENRRQDQRQHYEEALQSFRQLLQNSPDRYLPHFALTLYNLGNLDLHENRRDEARKYYDEALKIQLQLGRQDPDVYLADAAMTLNNLGNLDLMENRPDAAREHCEGALKIVSQLAQRNTELYLPDVAMALGNLGSLDLQQSKLDDARQHYEEALKSYRQLEQEHPGSYVRDVNETTAILKNLDQNKTRPYDPALGTAGP